MELLLVHPGKAYLPELRAYRRAFSPHFQVREVVAGELGGRSHPGKILYFIMGFWPGRYEAHRVVHDYRSLSVGALPVLKDALKRGLNGKPDLRVFANEVIEREMAFKDGVPACRLDMGVHLDLIPPRAADHRTEFDFCYVGDVTRERQADRMLRGFTERADGRTIALAGEVEPVLRGEFEGVAGVEFLDRVPLAEAYALMVRSETGVCYLPDRRPYRFQTPVKVLEYAAMGLKVVVNDTPSNLDTIARLGLSALVMRSFEFPTREQVELLDDNRAFDAERIGWKHLIAESGIVEQIRR